MDLTDEQLVEMLKSTTKLLDSYCQLAAERNLFVAITTNVWEKDSPSQFTKIKLVSVTKQYDVED